MKKRMRAAIYARVSTSHHDQNPEVQLTTLRRFCQLRGWDIAHEIVDHGFTGSHDKRPGLKQLISLAASRDVDAIVVLKLDRLFRSLKHLVTALDDFAALGIEFVAVKDNVDYSTPSGKLFVQVLGSLAEFEKALIRERTMLGLQHAKAKGKLLGRPKVIDDKEIHNLIDQGLSHREIHKRLGISKGTIWRAIRNRPEKPLKTRQENLSDFSIESSDSESPSNERIVGASKSGNWDDSSGIEDL